MNAIAKYGDFLESGPRAASVSNVETYWGYIIRSQTRERSATILLQWLSAILGVSLIIAALGLWVLPGSSMSQDVLGFKLGLTMMFVACGMALIWFASHGTSYEVQLDLSRRELREALRNKSGKARVQNRLKFEDIDAVFIDRAAGEGQKARLMVRMADCYRAIEIAKDYEENLTHLQGRLGRDILGLADEKRKKNNRGFMFTGAKGVIAPAMAA